MACRVASRHPEAGTRFQLGADCTMATIDMPRARSPFEIPTNYDPPHNRARVPWHCGKSRHDRRAEHSWPPPTTDPCTRHDPDSHQQSLATYKVVTNQHWERMAYP